MTLRDVFIKIGDLPGARELADFIESSDYYKAPASTKYHGAYYGGLEEHSMHVVDNLLRLSEVFKIQWDRPESPYIIGAFHDLCKVDFYKVSMRNVKNKDTGKWEEKPFYEVDDREPLGHGEKSVIILQRYLKLTRQEEFAIRFHMGAFGDRDYVMAYSNACNKYPEIMVVALADHLAGVRETLDEAGDLPSRYAELLLGSRVEGDIQ